MHERFQMRATYSFKNTSFSIKSVVILSDFDPKVTFI